MIGWRASVTATLAGCGARRALSLPDNPRPFASAPVDFTTQIRPLLSDRCFRCHGPDAGKRKAELRLDVAAGALKPLDNGWAVVKPGQPERSELVRRVFADDDDMMPPSESRLSLTDAEKALLLRWVKEGADYRPHWAFLPVRSEPLPPRPAGASSTEPDRYASSPGGSPTRDFTWHPRPRARRSFAGRR